MTLALLERALGAAEQIPANSLAAIAMSALATGASRALVSSRQPSGRLRNALIQSDRPFIVAIEDPRTALLDLVIDDGIELPAATQAVATSCAALMNFPPVANALLLRSGRDWHPETAVAIARHLGLALGDGESAEIAAALMPSAAVRQQHDAVGWWNGLAASEQEMVTGALQAYLDAGEEGRELGITWAGELFFSAQPDAPATGPIDITGRARCILRGPDIMLPPGSWTAALSLLFSREAAEHEFLVEVCTDRQLTTASLRAAHEGSAQIGLEFALDEQSERTVSIRLSTVRAAFDGTITVLEANLVRAAAPETGGDG